MSVTISNTHKPANNAWYAKNTVPKLLLQATENVTVTLYFKDQDAQDWEPTDVAFSGSYSPDFNGEIWIDFNGIYDSFISTGMPASDQASMAQNKAWYHFRAVIFDSHGNNVSTAITWKVFNAKLKSAVSFGQWISMHFLTNQPLEKLTNYEAPEWLSWIDVSQSGSTNLVVRFYPKSGGTLDADVFTPSSAGCWSVNVRYSRLVRMVSALPRQLYGYYDLILFSTRDDSELCRQRYIYKEMSGMEKYFCFVNAMGGIDTLICDGENVLQPETTHNVGRFADRYRALDDTEDRRKWIQNTGMMPTKHRNWIYELLTTKQGGQKYDPATMSYLGIVVDSSDIAVSDYGQLASVSFGYILDDADNVIPETEMAADRMLHQSIADASDEMDDISVKSVAVFEEDDHGNFETDELEIAATTIYVSESHTLTMERVQQIYYFIDGSDIASGSFALSALPYVITKQKNETIRFATQSKNVKSLVINYYK